MSLNLVASTDAILSAMNVYWNANAPGTPTLVFEANERDLKPHPNDSRDPWARIVVRHGTNPQPPLSGSPTAKRFWRSGIAFVQIFVPWTDASCFTTAQELAQVARQAFEGKRAVLGDGSVVFTRVDVREKGQDGPWYRIDVNATFKWDELVDVS